MIRIGRSLGSASGLAILAISAAALAAPTYDVLIKNARVVDGTGAPWFRADVAVTSDTIAAIGNLDPEATASVVIDAADRYLAPGFIDVHTHCEGDFQKTPQAQNFARMGVTTVISGNCGSSYLDIDDALTSHEAMGIGINLATLVGQGTVRGKVVGNVNRDASTTEVEKMRQLVERAMQDGAVGMSTGLIYTPGLWTKTHELTELARGAAAYGGVYATHMRSEGSSIEKAIQEALSIGRDAGLPVEISHFKMTDPRRHGQTSLTVKMVEDARAAGQDVTVDQYLYTASSTSIRTILPDWAVEGTTTDILGRLRDPETRAKIVREIIQSRRDEQRRKDMSYVRVVNFSPDRSINGKNLVEIARQWKNSDTWEAQVGVVIDIVTSGGAGMVSHSIDENDVQTIARYPNTMFASDSGLREFGVGVPHPRGYGNNARALGRYCRDLKLFSVEECVRRMTSLPARTFRLLNRGILRPGSAADFVVFDLARVNDPSTFDKPHAYSEGFDEVWVNGRPLITGGKLTEERPGRALRGPGYKRTTPLLIRPSAVGVVHGG